MATHKRNKRKRKAPIGPQAIADLYRIALTWTDDKRRARVLVERYLQGALQAAI